MSTFKGSFSKKMRKTPSSHIIHSLWAEYYWIVRDSEPIRLHKTKRSLRVYILNISCFSNYSWQRCRCIFILFFHIQVLSWSVFDMQLNVVYSKIGNPVILPNWSCKCCFGIAEIANQASTFPGKNRLTHQTCFTFTRSRANLNGPIRNTFIVFNWNQSETVLF